jgi:hypothetical protein
MKLILGFLVVALSTFTGVAFGSPSNEPQVIEVSFDGTNFKPFSSVASGSLEIGAQNASAFTAKVTLKAK